MASRRAVAIDGDRLRIGTLGRFLAARSAVVPLPVNATMAAAPMASATSAAAAEIACAVVCSGVGCSASMIER